MRLVRYGVTAFCPTSVACSPAVLERLLESMRRARGSARPHARVLPAHLESNFINPDFRGAQPLDCLRRPPRLGPDGLALAESVEARGVLGRRHPASDRGAPARRRHRHPGRRTRRRARPGEGAGRRRPSGVAGPLGRDLRAGAGGDRRRRAACDPPVQPDVATHAPRPRPDRRRPGRGRRGGGDHLRRLSRPPRGRHRGHPRQARGADHGHHRRQRRGRPAGRQQGLASVAVRSP